MIRGVKQAATVEAGLLASAEARKLHAAAASLQEAYAKPGVLARKGDDFTVNGPKMCIRDRSGNVAGHSFRLARSRAGGQRQKTRQS